MGDGVLPVRWYEYRGSWGEGNSEVIEEALVTIYVNGVELATIMCTPRQQVELALGFLKNERLIESLDEVEATFVSRNGCCADIWLTHTVEKTQRVVITSGCGGGVTFDDPSVDIKPLQDAMRTTPEALFDLFRRLNFPGGLYARARGVHASGLTDGVNLLALAEDVGRHNTIDKLAGECLLKGIDAGGKILLTTGRISSEMLRKAALMGCPIIASRNSPTSMSVTMAQRWNITLAGYVRQGSMRVYTHPERLGFPGATPRGLPIQLSTRRSAQ